MVAVVLTMAMTILPCTLGENGTSCGACRRCTHQQTGTRLGRQILAGAPGPVAYQTGDRVRRPALAAPPTVTYTARRATCRHLGRRHRDDAGVVARRYCGPCNKDLDVFECIHPDETKRGRHPLPTLADCHRCEDHEGR